MLPSTCSPNKKLLYHLCCGICGIPGWEQLIAEGYEVIAFFDGGNIHPRQEMERRDAAAAQVAERIGTPLLHEGYPVAQWQAFIAGHEDQPEGGTRCPLCFEHQLRQAARVACQQGAPYLCTSLTLSRHKSPQLINAIGAKVAADFGLNWVEKVWRKGGGIARADGVAREMGLYRQTWCGCIYSQKKNHDQR